jgi:hypothetical protein
MARKRKAAPVVDELEELEDELEDLDEEEEEDVEEEDEDVEDEDEEDEDLDDDEDEEDEDEDEDEDEEEAPRKKSKKTRKKKPRDDGKVGSAELAEALGTDGRNLRVMLRDRQVKKNPANNRYEWDSLPAALKAMKFKNIAAAKAALVESRKARLDELKDRVSKTRAATKKKTSSKKKSSA